MASIQKDIEELRTYHKQLAWYQRWFFPSNLADVLKDPTSTSSHICQVFNKNVSFWSYPLFWGIWRFSNSNTFSIYKRLREASLDGYSSEFLYYFDANDTLEKKQTLDRLDSTKASLVVKILKFMNQEQPLSSQEANDYFEVVIEHSELDMVFAALEPLNNTGLLNSENRKENFFNLVNHPTLASRLGGLNATFEALSKTKLLSNDQKQDNFEAILKRKLTHGGDLHCALIRVPNSLALFQGDDAQKLFKLIAGHEDPERVTYILAGINNLGIRINDEILNFFQNKQDSFWQNETIATLNILYEQGLIQGDDNEKMNVVLSVLKHKCAYNLAGIVSVLKKNQLLDQHNFELVLQHSRSDSLLEMLEQLDKQSELTEENFYINYFGLSKKSINEPQSVLFLVRETLNILFNRKFLTKETVSQYLQAIDPYKFRSNTSLIPGVTVALDSLGLLNSQFGLTNFETAINDQFCGSYSTLLPLLQDISPYIPEQNQTNFNLLTSYLERNAPQNFYYGNTAFMFRILKANNLLSQQNFEQVLAHENPPRLEELIFFISRHDRPSLLTGENAQLTLNLLLRHTSLLQYLRNNITATHLRDHWHPHITTILQTPNLTPPELAQALENYVRFDILQIRRPIPVIQHNNEQALINRGQSTHTASVHAATDLTAWLLLETHKKDARGLINLAGLWPVIEHNFLQRKAKIEQEIQKLESSPATLTETQVQQLTHTRTILDDICKTETQMSAAKDCLKRLSNVSCDIILSAEKKQTALSYIRESDLKEDDVIHALLPGLMEQERQESKLSLQQFIFWLYEEVAITPSKPDYILRFIQALYEIQRGYNLDDSGNDDLTETDHSICYGGTANKFPELLTGLSSLIQFVFIDEDSIRLSIKQQLINQVLPYCESLLQQAHQGNLTAKARFCALIDQLMSSNEVSTIYETFFSEPNFITQIKAEFRLYTLLFGESGLEQQFALFKDHNLPYIPAISSQKEVNAFYSSDFLNAFNHYVEAKNQFEQERPQSKSPVTILAGIGLMSDSKVDDFENENSKPHIDTFHT